MRAISLIKVIDGVILREERDQHIVFFDLAKIVTESL